MASNIFNSVSSFLSGLLKIIPGIQLVTSQIAPYFLCVAFVLLVFGTMRGFLQNDTPHLFGNLLRVVILVVLIGNSSAIESVISNAVTAFCNVQVSSGFFSTNGSNSGLLNVNSIFNTIAEKVAGVSSSQSMLQQLINTISTVTNPLYQVLYAIYVLALLLCEFIVAGMNVLQQCIITFLNLYVPIGFAEFSIPNLRGQAEAFFKSYVGVLCWPVGWVLANVVTVNLLQALNPPSSWDTGSLLMAIVLCVPLVLWMVIGYVLAPFYVQKVVVRGGSELQAFAGAMISAVGGTTGSVYGGAFGLAKSATLGLTQGVGAIRSPIGNGGYSRNGTSGSQLTNNSAAEGNDGSGQDGMGTDVLGSLLPAHNGVQNSRGSNGGAAARARNLGVWGVARVIDAGEFAARTAGNMASTLGGLVADASGNRIGPEQNFSFPRTKRNLWNRSSRRAANYLNQNQEQDQSTL
jgi:hypothetical protein